MRKNTNNRPAANLKKINFYSMFEETVPHVAFFWHQMDPVSLPEPNLTIFQGKLLNKNFESDKWESYIFEMQPDKIYKRSLQTSEYIEFSHLHACFLKKFNHYDSQYPNYKYGFRLQINNHLSFFVTDQADQFKKWFMMLRRFCVLEKFNRKYKVIAQLKYNDPIFGQSCYTCVRLSDAGYYLTKIIQKETLSQQQKNVMFKELQHLRRLNHPQLIRLIETYEDEVNIYQVFDQYMGGDLRQHLRETQLAYQGDVTSSAIEEKMLADLMYNLIGAISHMHSKGIFHRDIKLDNLFVPESKRLPFVLLSNLCYSESFKLNKGASSPQQGYKKCGTPGYVAPEIFKTKNYDQKIDIFSLGVVFYILVYGKMPFEGKDQEEILKANERGEIDFKAEKRLCPKISQSGIDIMKSMLHKDPVKRFTAAQALNHHWFIKMKTKDEHRPRGQQLGRGRSLSTIAENSEIMELTQSFILQRPSRHDIPQNFASKKNLAPSSSPHQNRLKPQAYQKEQQPQPIQIVEPDWVDKEFEYGNPISQKLPWMNEFVKIPSKNRHSHTPSRMDNFMP